MRKFKMKGFAVVFLLFTILSAVSYGQSERQESFLIYGTASIPTGDFGKDIGTGAGITLRHGFSVGNNAGLAETGLGFGAELNIKTGISGLLWVFGVKAFFNGVNANKVSVKFSSDAGDSLDINPQFGVWTNVPIMSGLRYNINISDKWAIYGIAMGGVNLAWHPYRKVYASNLHTDTVRTALAENTNYNLTTNFGYEAGVGILFDHTYNLGIRYLNLGTPRYDGEQTLGSFLITGPYLVVPNNKIVGEPQSISMIEIIFGIEL